MWALYAVFGSLSSKANGERVTMAAEAGAMVAVAMFAFRAGDVSDFRRVTALSAIFMIVTGLMSAAGVLTQFYAFRIAPQNHQGTVAMLGGMFPVLGFAILDLMHRVGIPGGSPGSSRQWIGVALAALGLWFVGSGR
ncbi:MAG: hypothetical protein HY435_02040 [Candidatus Liptonbacteria bacterium]|nr:hypothetical protein [Candidatus Liptonbacteria bacterium]